MEGRGWAERGWAGLRPVATEGGEGRADRGGVGDDRTGAVPRAGLWPRPLLHMVEGTHNL